MIRLGKDKTLDNYFIDENGVITDSNGKIQNTFIHGDYLIFKGKGVHQIQMWTNYGWRDTKIWAIHHLDENKLNNSLSNLVYLTNSEHSKLHNLGIKNNFYNCKHSEETKQKISRSNKGKKFSLGRKLSEETKKKISESLKKTFFFEIGRMTGSCTLIQ